MKDFPRFFTKQLLAFAALAFLIVVVDLVLYVAIALHESDTNLAEPAEIVHTVTGGLAPDEGGSYRIAEDAARLLDAKGAWALLIGSGGEVVWKFKAPDEVVHPYSLNDIALFSHYGYLEDYPAFLWSRDDGLLVVGLPKNSYAMYSVTGMPQSTIAKLPFYILVILIADLLIFFAAYLLSRRRTVKSIEPITGALDGLASGQEVSVSLRGDLKEVGERINETSEIIRKKDNARESWIRGISHDIRTPLSMITGYADAIAKDETATDKVRADASLIRSQGLKIKDLVVDLNTASQLEYDMQPLHVEVIPVAGLLREVVVEYLNNGLGDGFSLDLVIDDAAVDLTATGDKRLLKRAVQNLVQNAITHNADGCSITVALRTRLDGATEYCSIVVEDTGRGMAANKLVLLQSKLLQSTYAPVERTTDIHGLGLVLVEKIVRAHGGIMQITSKKDAGFSATLYLPMQHA